MSGLEIRKATVTDVEAAIRDLGFTETKVAEMINQLTEFFRKEDPTGNNPTLFACLQLKGLEAEINRDQVNQIVVGVSEKLNDTVYSRTFEAREGNMTLQIFFSLHEITDRALSEFVKSGVEEPARWSRRD